MAKTKNATKVARFPRTKVQEGSSPAPRRRLGPNVVCMFSHDRDPIVQPRRRGRLPRGVTRIKSVPRLKVGVLAEIVYSKTCPENIGARVRVVNHRKDGWLTVKSERRLKWFDAKTGERGADRIVAVPEEQLRRLWTDPARGRVADGCQGFVVTKA